MAKKKSKYNKNKSKKVEKIEDVYKIINRVQMNEKVDNFYITDFELKHIINNVINDSKIDYKVTEFKSKIKYKVFPGNVKFCEEKDIDEFEQEMKEAFDDLFR